MAGYKTWAADDVLAAADLNSYLMAQAVPRFADTSTRAGAILSPAEGQLTYRIDAEVFEQWNGTAWVEIWNPATAEIPTYIQNYRTGIQYRWDGEQWLKSFEGEYAPGYWGVVSGS